MKSSRRKQTKPIRVSYGPDADTTDSAPFENQGPEDDLSNGVSTPPETQPKDVIDPSEAEIISCEKCPEIISCEKCPETFPSHSHLEKHDQALHSIDKSAQSENQERSFPTEYHRLASELQQHEVKPIGNGHIKPSTPSSEKDSTEMMELPLDKDAKDLAEDSSFKVDGTRIFHPDAYCEMCDREFCNKYFLKTHKANKHGIYDKSPSPYPISSVSSLMSPQEFTPIAPMAPVTPIAPTPQFIFEPMSLQQPLQLQKRSPQLPPPMPLMPPMPPITSLPIIPTQNTMSAVIAPLTEAPSKEKSSTTPSSSTPSIKSAQDLEDFCEVCQKHFCNKYYLKKHKLDVHGIATPDFASNRRSRPSTTSVEPLNPPITTVTSTPIATLPQNIAPMGGVMVLNPFVPPVAIIQAQSLLTQQQLQANPNPVISTQIAMSQHPSEIPPPIFTMSGNLPTTQSGQPAINDSLRSIGILNAEAYCKMCKKEFCNKYFLKIHMANKHAIFEDGWQAVNPWSRPLTAPNADTKVIQSLLQGIKREPTDGDEVKGPPVDDREAYITYCALCSMEFASKYSYKIHMLNVHGLMSDGSIGNIAEEQRELNSIHQPFLGLQHSPLGDKQKDPCSNGMDNSKMSALFGNVIAARLADRVTCDICNKELCNKYFLKAHNQKVHGLEMEDSELTKEDLPNTPKGSNMQGDMLQKQCDLMETAVANTQGVFVKNIGNNPSHEELLDRGIDPESYCVLCKKQFSSKYFQRAHKLNVHGIVGKSEMDSDSPPIKAMDSPSKQGNEEAGKFEKHTWRWKEPVNSARVICELCNKELCNKYFLRSHKLNKHGILLEDQKTPTTSTAGSPGPIDMSEMDNGSTSSNLTDYSEKNSKPALAMDLVKDKTSPLDSRKNSQQWLEGFKIKSEDEASMNNRYNNFTEICALCDKRFKSTKWLHAHILKDHAQPMMGPLSTTAQHGMDKKVNSIEGSPDLMCHFCGKVFNSELAVHLHMIQDHNAQVNLQADTDIAMKVATVHNNFDQKMVAVSKHRLYSCVHCDYKTRWLSNIYSHEERKHHINKGSYGKYTCKACLKSFLYEHSLIRHMVEQHQNKGQSLTPVCDPPTKSAEVKKQMNRYKCARCGKRFISRELCQIHIRVEHIRAKKNPIHGYSVSKVVVHPKKFSSRVAKHLRRHLTNRALQSLSSDQQTLDADAEAPMLAIVDKAPQVTNNQTGNNYVLQPFKLEAMEQDVNFVAAVVHLPVVKRVTEQLTTTFTLTPMEH